MKTFELNFKVRLSKKQVWEYNQLKPADQMRYLVSFTHNNGFRTTWSTGMFESRSHSPLEDLRKQYSPKRSPYNRDALANHNVMHHLKWKLQLEKERLFRNLSVNQLRKLTGS